MDREFAMQHASRVARYQLGGATIGGAVGYGATGNLDGALTGANFGMMGGSLAAHFNLVSIIYGSVPLRYAAMECRLEYRLQIRSLT